MNVYKAAPSYGWAWLIASGLIMFLIGLPAFSAGGPGGLIAPIVAWPFALAAFVLAYWFPSMRYELGPEELVLCYGPFSYPIPLKAIQTISKRNLAMSLWSSVRFPGFALWTVPYADEDAFLKDLQARLKG